MISSIKHLDSGCSKCDRVYRELSEALAHGEWYPGERLPVERVLVEYCQCSRVTLRAALDRLAKQHLIYRKQGSGTYVTDVQSRPHSWNIALIERVTNPSFTDSSFLNQQMLGFMRVASQRRFMSSVLMIDDQPDFFSEAERLNLSLRSYDGFIFAYPLTQGEIEELHRRNIRFVSLTQPIADVDNLVSYVDIDNLQGIYLAACHLLELGYRHPLLLNGPLERPYNQAKIMGFKKALEQYHLPFDEKTMVFTTEPNDSELTERLVREILGHSDLEFDSMLVYGDWATYGAIKELRRHGISVPEDLALVRYGSARWVDKVLDLPIASIQQPLDAQIAAGADLLLRLLERKSRACVVQILQPSLIVGDSSGCFLKSPRSPLVSGSTCVGADSKNEMKTSGEGCQEL